MCVVSYQSCCIAGNDFNLNFTLFQNDGATPEDLTGAAVIMQLLNNDCSEGVVIDMNGGVTDAINGKVEFFLTNQETQSLLPVTPTGECETKKSYVADIQVTWPDDTKEVLLRVTATFEQGRNR